MSKITNNTKVQEFIQHNYLNMTDREMAKELGIPKTTIQNYRVKHNLHKVRMGLPKFKQEPFEVLMPTEFPEYYISNTGRLVNIKHNYVLTPQIKQGYLKYSIKIDGKYRYLFLHRLVAQAFIPNNNNKSCINHRDGNKLNNTILNLEWCTIAENNIHAHKMGLVSYDKTITSQEAKRIIQLLNEGYSVECILQEIPSATKSIINHIKGKRRWKRFEYLMKW